MTADGLGTTAIAARLGISRQAVKGLKQRARLAEEGLKWDRAHELR